jgi:general secretion pathway protein C
LYYAVRAGRFDDSGASCATSGNLPVTLHHRTRFHRRFMQRLPRLVELLLVIALCGLAAWWFTHLAGGRAIPVPPQASSALAGGPSRVDAALASARLFGSRPPGVLSDNVRALGVVADDSGRGSVIVSIDGQPPKVYRVGDTLDGRLVAAIRPQEIELESGGARQTFRLPPRVAANGVTVFGTGAPPPSAEAPASTPGMVSPPPAGPTPYASPAAGAPVSLTPLQPNGEPPDRIPRRSQMRGERP